MFIVQNFLNEDFQRQRNFVCGRYFGRYVLVSSKENMKLMASMLGTIRALIAPLMARQVLDNYAEYPGQGLAILTVLPAHQAMFDFILNRKPVNA